MKPNFNQTDAKEMMMKEPKHKGRHHAKGKKKHSRGRKRA